MVPNIILPSIHNLEQTIPNGWKGSSAQLQSPTT
ncbi:uncharacterized protein J3R85_012559 [Psidium guajava]|nr:uncharacterized protein J3R85_012559 [Psidium guajava]